MKAYALFLAPLSTIILAASCLAAGVVVEVQDAAASDSDISTYSDKLATRIESQWQPTSSADDNAEAVIVVKKNGALVHIANEKSSGKSEFDKMAMQAIKAAAPFPTAPFDGPVRIKVIFPHEMADEIIAKTKGNSEIASAKVGAQFQDADHPIGLRVPLQGRVDAAGDPMMHIDAQAAQNGFDQPMQGGAAADGALPRPMQMQAEVDNHGTPRIPKWKLDAGYDFLLGRFYVGFIGVDNPPIPVVMMSARIAATWRGARPNPCHIRLFKVRDDSNAYYFICLENRFGPCGWLVPQPKTEPGARQWAIYYAQPREPEANPPGS